MRYLGWIRVLPRRQWLAVANAADDVDCWRELHEYARTMWPHRWHLRGLSLVVLPEGQHPARRDS